MLSMTRMEGLQRGRNAVNAGGSVLSAKEESIRCIDQAGSDANMFGQEPAWSRRSGE